MAQDLEIVDLKIFFSNCKLAKRQGVERVTADARLEFKPGGNGQSATSDTFTFVSPLGPIEAEELSWYLEQFYKWPWGPFLVRGHKTETMLLPPCKRSSPVPVILSWPMTRRCIT